MVQIMIGELPSDMMGYALPDKIVIDKRKVLRSFPKHLELGVMSVVLHELAHYSLHFDKEFKEFGSQLSPTEFHAVREWEAETVCVMTMNNTYGVHLKRQDKYISHFAREIENVKTREFTMLKVVSELTEKIKEIEEVAFGFFEEVNK